MAFFATPDPTVLFCDGSEGQTVECDGQLIAIVYEGSADILTVAFLLNKSELTRCSVGGQTNAIQILSP